MHAAERTGGLTASVSERHDYVKTARVQGIDHDSRANSAVDDLKIIVLEVGSDKPRRNQDDVALSRHPGNVLDHDFQSAQGNTALVLTGIQYACTDAIDQRSGIAQRYRLMRSRIKLRGFAPGSLLQSNLSSLRVALIQNEICLVVADVRAIMPFAH